MEAMQQQMSKGGDPNLNAAGMESMMEMLAAVNKDPALAKQMEGMWKMMDEMSQNDPEEYKKFVDGNMREMQDSQKEEKLKIDKANTIVSTPYFQFSIRPSKLVTIQAKKEKEVKLFDFGSQELKESFTDNPDTGDALETHKVYLNLVYHENVLPPLNKEKDFADPKDDRTWQVIPIVWSDACERSNLQNCRVITYDAHISNVVHDKMRENTKTFQNILHYIL